MALIANTYYEERIPETAKLIPEGVVTILDVGCGKGFFLNMLPAKYQRLGLDSSSEVLRYVKTRTILGNIAKLPFPDRSFDLVTCLEVLEHLPDGVYREAINEIERVARKYIILSVPNRENLNQALLECPICRYRFHLYGHSRSFSALILKTLFRGFDPLSIKEIGPRSVDTYPQVISLAYGVLTKPRLPENAVCPRCGYKEQAAYPINKAGKGYLLYRLLLPLCLMAKLIWRQRNKNQWLLSLYKRR